MSASIPLPRAGLSAPWFFALALGWSWLFWIPLVLVGWPVTTPPGALLVAAGGIGPTAAALLLLRTRHTAEGRADYWRRVIDLQRIRPLWCAAALLLPFAWNALGILTGVILGEGPPEFEVAARLLASPLTILPFAVFILLFGPIPEELGWRGYALDALQARFNALASSLVLGVIWVVWHWPMFFMEGSILQTAFPIGTAVFWRGWALSVVAGTILYTWIYNHTGRSILSAILLHFSMNFANEVLRAQAAFTVYRSLWLAILAATIVLIWGPGTLTRERNDPGNARDG
jgi:membrane protease YdiL (CAAX protease family)